MMARQILLNWLSTSTMAYICCALVPLASRIDPALSRTISISFEDKFRRKGVRSSGFSIPAPMALESRRRKWVWDAGNWSQRMNQRLSPNRSLMRSSWSAVKTTNDSPIPPAPIRAIDARLSARSTILWTNSSRPKKIFGGGGGNSP